MEYFSLSFAFNYFSLTGLMVVASLSGHPSLAADIGMAHSVTAVLFLGLSANARNVILKSSGEKSHIFFFMRSALMLPMFLASIFICGKFHDVGYLLAGMLTMRRAAEWLMEIALSEREVRRETSYAKGYFLVQAALFSLVCLSLVAAGRSFFTWSLAIWSVSPLLWLRLEPGRPKLDFSGLRDLFPHVGSTLIVGIGLYMFRGMLILLLGKEYAGDLFSAFALGGIVPSIYGNVLGPGIESETRRGGAGWAQALKHDALKYLFGAMSLAGAAILIWTKSTLFFEFLGKSDLFWGAVGASLVGGAVMLLVQVERTALLQSEAVDNVFAPDLLMNLVIIASVPYAFYLLGERSLIFLFLWNSFTGWLFYKSYAAMAERPPGVGVSSAAGNDPRCLAKYAIAVLVVLPVYFQLGHGLFLDHSLAYDSGGVLKDLPIPVLVAACCLGILLLSNYRYTVRTLYLIFTVFFLMAVSAAVSAAGDMAAMKAKILLMIQYLLPWSGLILGRMFVDDESDLKIIQRAFLGVVTFIAVLQLAVSFLHGHMMLESYLYIFSIYQTPQYVPVILIGAYLISLFGLYDRSRAWVMALSFIMGVYAIASTSRSAVLMLIAGALIFLIAKPKDRLRRMNAALVLLSLLGGSMLNSPSANRKSTLLSANQEQIAALTGKYKELAGPPGIHPWDYYIDRIEHGEKRNLLFGQKSMPDRAAHPSAHNYYLDYVYGFGLVPLLPFIAFIFYSLAGFWRQRRRLISSPSLTGLCFVLLFLVLFDNFVKVGLRQPYPGIFSFFLWGVLLRMMNAEHCAGPVISDDRAGSPCCPALSGDLTPMRIALINLTGGGMSGGYRKYLLNMLPRLAGHPKVDSVLCASPLGLGVPMHFQNLSKVKFVDCETFRFGRHNPGPLLERSLRDFDPHVLFLPVERAVDFGTVPSVTMLQNMAPLMPFNGSGLGGKLRGGAQYFETKLAVRRATNVIAVSCFVKDFLVGRWGVPPSKVEVICFGSNQPSVQAVRPPSLLHERSGGFIFTAGSAEPYRGWEDLIEALKEAALRGMEPVQLVIGGAAGNEPSPYVRRLRRLADESGVGDRVCWAGALNESEMAWCFGHCLAFVMTSRVESFGFVSLEALAHGCQCIAAENPPSPEIFGDQAVYYKSGNARSLAEAIGIVLGRSAAERGEMALRSVERAARFSWDVAVEKTVETLGRAIRLGR